MMTHSNTSLSVAQKRIWFECQSGKTLQNHVALVYELKGEFIPSVMQQALSQLVAEHDIFRTTIFTSGKNLERFVHEHMKVDLKCLSLEPHSEVYPTIHQLVERSFNLSTGPLFRFTLLQKNEQENILVLVFHRLIINTCVLKKIVTEISRHYHAIFQQQVSLVEPKLSYETLVTYEKNYRDESHYRETVRHWSSRIKDKQFYLDLTKLPESEENLVRVRSHRLTLNEVISEKITTFCHHFSCSPEHVFLSTLQALLYRYSDNPDIVINRPDEIIYQNIWKEILGPTSNILPWNIRLHSSTNLVDLLSQNQKFDAYKKYYPNAHIADIVRTVRSRFNHHFDGFFSNVSFEQEYIPFHEFILPNVTVRALPQYIHRTRTEELQVFFDEYKNNFFLSFDYSVKFSSNAVKYFAQHYEQLLHNLLNNPQQRLSIVNFLSKEEKKQLLAPPLSLNSDYSDIVTLFEQTVKRYPNHIALIDEGTSLPYEKLNALANQLGHALKARNIKSNDCIGLAMGRNAGMVIATLGILKAGAAYVPLDPTYPRERLAYMMQDAGISLVITEKIFESFIKSCHPVETLLLDKDLQTISSFPEHNLDLKLNLDDLAYVIYTSGSTGKPKGVLVPHRGLPNVAHYQIELFAISPNMRCLQCGSINFDITALELYGPLIAGATIYIASQEKRTAPLQLQQYIIQHAIQVIVITPSVLSQFDWRPMPDLLTIASGGEACEQKLMDFWAHGRRFINAYGPTEITIASHFKEYEPNTLFNNLGQPLPNVTACILDSHKNILPVGVAGELYIGGVGLAQGYLNLPELTHEKFIADPTRGFPPLKKGGVGGTFQNILYRTNDLAYRLENGDFMYLGRNDDQVKIRGLRVELGEIEEKIKTFPNIERVLVRVFSHETLGKLLIAYFIQNSLKKPINESTLREYLHDSLPEHMVPAYLINIASFPLMRNGKIDYQALPNPFVSTDQFDHEQCSKIEQALLQIFAELFKMDEKTLSLEHDFFALGGHSLLATQMIARIQQNLKLHLPVAKVFELRSIKKLAEYLSTLVEQITNELLLVHAPKNKKIPLSMAQKQMWFFYQLDKSSALYNIPFTIRFKNCDAELLVKSLYHIVDNNPSFRTIFEEGSDEPHQRILKKITFDIPIYESSELFHKNIQQWDIEPFDLLQFPLFRFSVHPTAEETWLYFNIHHIIFDGWSLKIFMHQLGQIYSALAKEEKLPSIENKYNYGDFSYSQTLWNKEHKLDNQLAFWQSFLQGVEPTLNLPTDFPYPKLQNYQGDTVPLHLSKELTDKLKTLALENKTTLFAVLLTAYFILLYRYTKQSDIVIGTPIAGRYLSQFEPIIGFFVNESIYRQQVSNTKTFIELLESVHQNACDAAENQTVAFNQIIEAMNIYSDPKQNPLFQVMFSLQTGHQLDGKLTNTDISYHITEGHQKTAKFDISLLFNEISHGELEGFVEYRTDLFTEISIQHLCAHYTNIIEAIIANPSITIAELTILSFEEIQYLVNTWPYGEKKSVPEKSVLEMIQVVAKNHPHVTALTFQDISLTYQEFWRKVETLADLLTNRGEQEKNTIIGILMPRGVEMIIAMCAIWKSGAAFLPLDADYPDERLLYMVEDSDTQVIVSVSELKEKQYIFKKAGVVFVQVNEEMKNHPCPAPISSTGQALYKGGNHSDGSSLNSLAYIIYTSGSTGNPKGVLLEHRGLSNLVHYMHDLYELYPAMKVLQFASINFDTSMGEIFSALSKGASLYIANNATRQSTEILQDYIDVNQLALIALPPIVLEGLEKRPMPHLKIIDFGGDTCDPATINYWKNHCRLINGYGPTETTVISSTKIYDETTPASQNIGRPLYNTEIFILDEDLNPVPTGVLGELFIGGLGLARGYINQEKLSLERFTLHPFSDDPDARLYRTGDYGRWLPNGDIEFTGRIDNQVKIRGFRIEMGEIETLLNAYPTIKQAAVIAKKEEQRLIAFFTSEQALDIAELTAYLQHHLPEYMIPSAFIKLESLPLNLSGKIDRKALSNKDYKDTHYIHALVEPTNEMEQQLANIWKTLLKTDQIGIDHSFFELGGHSLLITQMISRVKKELKLILSVAKVFELRTIRKLSAHLLTLQEEAKENLVLWHAPEKNKAVLSYAQKQMWFFYQLHPELATYNIPMILRFENANRDRLVQAFYYILEQNPIFRTVIDNTGEEPLQVVLEKLNVDIPVYDDLDRFEQDTHKWDRTPFDLVNGPLLRLALAQETNSILVYFNIHHIAFDGWSTDILMQQLTSTYAALEHNKPLPKLITRYSYLDYAYSQNRWLEENRLAEQVTFWQHHLQGAQTTLDLPTDFPYPAEQTFEGHTLSFTIPQTLTQSLKKLALNNQTTLFAVTLATFFILLYRYTKQTDIIIGAPIAGRPKTSLEKIMGFFVNESIYRQVLSNTQSFRELLTSVHQNACDAAENQALPFNEILDKLDILVDPKKNPLFQVLFSYQAVDPLAESDNGTSMRYSIEERAANGAKLDISLAITEALDGSLKAGVEYRTDLFTELSIQHLCAHYQNLLQEIISNPDASLASYRILSKPEYELLANVWPYGEAYPLPEKTTLEMIEETVNQYPDLPAMKFHDEFISYAEFWEKVTTLAHVIKSYLGLLGENKSVPYSVLKDVTTPDERSVEGTTPVPEKQNKAHFYSSPPLIIGLLMPRGMEMIIAMCAVWKAGAAFLPLDIDYPEDRLHYMVQDSDTHIIISVSQVKEKQAIFEGRDIVFIQADELQKKLSMSGLPPRNDALQGMHSENYSLDAPAYLLYTSGSTGNPKGVLLKHRGLSNLMPYMHDIYQLKAGMKVLQFTSINFDVSLGEIFPSLTKAACLYIVDADTRRSIPHLQEFIEKEHVQVISIPPAVLENFDKQPFSKLETAIIIGDTCDINTLQYWQKQCRLLNGYGPTEATVIVSSKLFKPGVPPQNIGRPLYNTELFILDEDLHPVPTGVMGELLIGGIALAQCYLHREDLTKEKFIPHPFSTDPDARLYRTGDFARWLPNGEIEFVGRIDNQVKIRGYRIEIGEIETLLNAYSGIKQAVVIAKKEQQLLVCYFSSQENIQPEQLNAYLAEKLPEYMVPAAFVQLDTLPVNLSGKIDRKILQAKDFRLLTQVRAFVTPISEMEKSLWKIWSETLKTDQFGIDNSFFELGGHSLLVTQMISRVKKHLKLNLWIAKVFELRTIRKLSEHLLTLQQEAKENLILWHAPDKNKAPLSYAQRQMWFFYQLHPELDTYNIPMLLRFENANQDLLIQALYHVIEQNPIFRTIIDNTEEEPVQVILEKLNVNIPVYESLDMFKHETTAWDTMPFDLVNGPVFRLALTRDKKDILVYFNIHHIAFDAWSTNILMQQLTSTYAAIEQNKPLPKLVSRYSYLDYAYSQNRWLEENRLAEQIAFWQHFLQGAQTTLDLPTDFPYPSEQTFKGNTLSFAVPESLTQSLKKLALDNQTTLFAVTLAAFFALLYRYTKQQDIIIGVPIAGRPRASLESLIGFFVNESLYRQGLSNTQSFRELLTSVHQNACDAAENQALPFNAILDKLNIPVDPKKNPLFQVLFNYEAADPFAETDNGTSMRYSIEGREIEGSKLDISLFIAEMPNGSLQAGVEYRTDLFTELSIQHLCAHYQNLLQEIVTNPDATLVSYRILSKSEYELLANVWPYGEAYPLPEKTALEMIEEAVIQYTDLPALVFENNVLTYASFWEKVTTLAHLIESHPIFVGANNIRPLTLIIGLLMPRGIEMIIAMCAVWKAGAAFLPLDAEYPDDRLQYMVKDSDTHLIVSVAALKEKQMVFDGMDVGFVEVDAPTENVIPKISMQQHFVKEDNHSDGPSLNELAYIIYTSGSTGNPKGVMVKHQGLSNLIPYLQDIYQLKSRMQVLQFTSINFDVSMAEIFPALVSGATLHIVNQPTRRSVTDLQQYIQHQHIQIVSIPPAVLEHFEQISLPTVQTIIIGGDTCDSRVVNFWKKQCRLINGYGPTEATVYALTKQFETNTNATTIGRPLYNVETFILDENLLPVPTGVMGELFIGGIGLAKGYLNRSELTEEKFIPNPFSSNSEAKLYRSGDYARWLPNGEIEFIGRIDNQVKIRGYRIEIGEIETLLNAYSGIKQAVVIAKKEQQLLVGYFSSKEKIQPEQLNTYLAEKLPEYMIPAAFVQLETLPVNLSGKIDRKVLQAKDFRLLNQVKAFVQPSSEMEKSLWTIWNETLKTDQFGIDNSFFELGGHSLLVTQMISRVKKYLKLNLSIAQVFELRTIRKLSEHLLTLQKDAKENLVLWHAPDSNRTALSHAQKQMWFFYQLNPDSNVYNIPMLMRFRNTQQHLLLQALHHVIEQNAIFRTVIDNTTEEPVQIILKTLNLDIPVYDSLEMFRQDTNKWNITPFDLVNGPVLRLAMAKENNDMLVYFNIHHIAFDAWSTDILLAQLTSTYRALEKNHPLPEFYTEYQYSDFAYSQNRWLDENRFNDHFAFWQHFLQDAQTTLDLPTDFPYPSEQTFKGNTLAFTVPEGLTQSLKNLALENQTTLFAVNLTAFFALLYRYTNQDDILIGVPIAGRYNTSVENIIGFFVNESLYRQRLSTTKTFKDLLKSVHQNACDAADNQALPFNEILDKLNIAVDPKKNPLFQVLFNYEALSSLHTEENLSIEFESFSDSQIAKLDISLIISEMPDGSLQGGVEYRTDLFTELSIQHLCAHYQNLLQEIATKPDATLGSYRILSEPEYEMLVHTWPYGNKKPLPEKTALAMIEEAVNNYADSAALIFENDVLTYASFWEKVTTLAHLIESYPVLIEANNIRPHTPIIGLLMPRGIDMIIAMCAIWKAGAAFLPLDADYPEERLQYMVKDSDTHLIVSVAALKEKQMFFEGMDVVFVEEDAPTENVIARSVLSASNDTLRGNIFKEESHSDGPSLNDLAYIIYTSGSTGNPKGVMLEHLGLSNLTQTTIKDYDLKNTTRVLQFHSINFDAAINTIFMTLCSGASLYIADNAIRYSPEALQHYLRKEKIELIDLPPALFEHFEKRPFPHLKTVILGGDVCDTQTLNYWKSQLRLINAYGPTEATVLSAKKVYKADTLPHNIGRPLDNIDIFILDENLHPVPTGVNGEIFIGGIGLARGYLYRDDLTKEKFISHPFSKNPDDRLYRSGDYARWLPNGEIEFIGRIDNQVKIRGYRIEIGEIETLLNAYSGIKQAVVVAKKEQQLLICYFSGNDTIKPEQLNHYLVEKLPEYMVPAAFIQLDTLPINLSGKIDRKALQAKDFRLINQVKTFIAPSNEIEKIVWKVWKEILKTDQFGIDNSFFELGGHSLLITQMISRIKKNLKLILSIAQVFELRTIRKLAEYLSTLEEKAKENLVLWHAPDKNKAPLSYAQKQMWFFYQINPDLSTYNIPMLLRFKHANQDLLIQAFNYLIEQTPVFRTVIDNTGEEPVQCILEKIEIPFPVYDNLQKFKHDTTEWDAIPFDLVNGPVLRLALAQDKNDILVYMNIHHIAFDGWSTGILMQQLTSIYAALEHNKPLPKLASRYSYLDYSYSQNRWLEEHRLAEQEAFWQHFLQDAQTTLDLPTDFPYPSEQTFAGNTLSFSVPEMIALSLKKVALDNQTTLFAVTLAAFFVLLYRYTKQQDIIIGVPIAGRPRTSLESIIGLFINEAIYRQGLSNNLSFRHLLTSVHKNACDAAENQVLPFNEILNKLNIPVDSKKNPLFQVLFNYQAVDPFAEIDNGTSMRYSLEERAPDGAKLDISLFISEMPNGSLKAGVEYRTDLFTELSIQHLCAHYQNLLQEIISNPDASLASYRILSKPEYELLANVWPYGEAYPLPEKTTLEMIEETVNQYPDLPAMKFHDEFISYAEFWEKVTTLAHVIKSYLGLLGENKSVPYSVLKDVTTPDERSVEGTTPVPEKQNKAHFYSSPPLIIGLLMPRGMEMIIAMCAVWKAGAAFLPLDIDYPEDRLHYMVQDSDTHIIISVSQVKEKQAIFEGRDIVFIQADELQKKLSMSGLPPRNDALQGMHSENYSLDAPAYLLYTSGSTGNPKGVLLKHRGLSNLMPYMHDIYQLKAGMKVLQFTSINFDVSLGEIFPSLTKAACLYIVDADTRRSIPHLQEFIEKEHVQVISIPPAVLENFDKQPFSKLETAIIIGDTCDINTLQYWQKQCRLLNGYGPTEATVIVSSKLFKPGVPPQNIGRPLYNTELFILDEDLHPVPTGVMGELLIGGIALAQCYLHREDLTKEKFIPHPFSTDPDARLYRTGDFARWLPNGEIEFVGRIDNQVKIRGYRIEIGEIETLLNAYSGIKQAVVIAKKEQQLLVCYFSSQENIQPEQLNAYLAEKLPEYMVPAAFVQLDTLPVNLSGKIDRKILQAKDFRLMKRIKVLIEPRNEIEAQLCQIWKEVLKTDQISVEDSFFDLGGHSLAASRVASRVQTRHSIVCPVPLIFKCKTIAALAESLQGKTIQDEAEINKKLMHADITRAKEMLGSFSKKLDDYHFNPRCILITGAHGFLGAHLLEALLKETDAEIICIVRAESEKDLQRKIKKDLERFNLISLANHPRVKWILGDLSKPMLGLSEKYYQHLCETIDSIYHSGAWVNHILPYESLRDTNVESTLTFLNMASRHHPKIINFISTTSVALAADDIENAGGYVQSKWVSEIILQEAEKHGFNIRIFRPGNITGHSKTGVCVAENNHALSLIKSCIQLGIAPNWNAPVEMLPVDLLSQAIVKWSLKSTLTRNTWSLNNIHLLSWKDYIHYLNELGFTIKTVSLDKWKKSLKILDENNALFAFKDFYLDATEDNPSGTYVERENILQEVELSYPESYQELIKLYWRYLKETGFV